MMIRERPIFLVEGNDVFRAVVKCHYPALIITKVIRRHGTWGLPFPHVGHRRWLLWPSNVHRTHHRIVMGAPHRRI